MADYRLKALLSVREYKEEAAKRYLGECLTALKEAEDEQKKLEKELERMIGNREEKRKEFSEKVMKGEMSAQEAIAADKYIERLKEMEEKKRDDIKAQKRVVRRKRQDVEGARADLLVANRDLKTLEKHKDKWQKKTAKELLTKQEDALEDTAQGIYLGKIINAKKENHE